MFIHLAMAINHSSETEENQMENILHLCDAQKNKAIDNTRL